MDKKAWTAAHNPDAEQCQDETCDDKLVWSVSPFLFQQSDLPGNLDVNGDVNKKCLVLEDHSMKETECDRNDLKPVCQCDASPEDPRECPILYSRLWLIRHPGTY